ncbi:Transposable element Tc3 transposase [Araneus ventricosus]|uniref:Transposable element Tc3 transposase n=1 Tax=Araneus ventricosus TaxID=182803 RepID=A0A4Y2JQ52_ARAVE|nr:Transposable element Tc3 transposase [Araneus ventricosus]
MSWTTEWTPVIFFSDEKRFNLDGPDGFQYYWHCLKQKEQYYSTRQQGGGNLMVWLVGFGSRSSLVFIKGRQNHKDYIQQLETELLPYGSDWGGENWIYQQDGASIPRS